MSLEPPSSLGVVAPQLGRQGLGLVRLEAAGVELDRRAGPDPDHQEVAVGGHHGVGPGGDLGEEGVDVVVHELAGAWRRRPRPARPSGRARPGARRIGPSDRPRAPDRAGAGSSSATHVPAGRGHCRRVGRPPDGASHRHRVGPGAGGPGSGTGRADRCAGRMGPAVRPASGGRRHRSASVRGSSQLNAYRQNRPPRALHSVSVMRAGARPKSGGDLGQQAPGHLAQVGVPARPGAGVDLDQRMVRGHLEGDRLAGGVEVGDERPDVLERLLGGAERPEPVDEAGAVGGGEERSPTWRPTAPSPVTRAAALNRATISSRELQAPMSPRVAKERPSPARASAWATPDVAVVLVDQVDQDVRRPPPTPRRGDPVSLVLCSASTVIARHSTPRRRRRASTPVIRSPSIFDRPGTFLYRPGSPGDPASGARPTGPLHWRP